MIGPAALAVGLRAPAVRGQAKPFAGVTMNGAAFQSVFHDYLKDYFPEFEEQSGMKVNFEQQAFPVYNQRMDLELSTKGSAYDCLQRHLHLQRPLDRRRLGHARSTSSSATRT